MDLQASWASDGKWYDFQWDNSLPATIPPLIQLLDLSQDMKQNRALKVKYDPGINPSNKFTLKSYLFNTVDTRLNIILIKKTIISITYMYLHGTTIFRCHVFSLTVIDVLH